MNVNEITKCDCIPSCSIQRLSSRLINFQRKIKHSREMAKHVQQTGQNDDNVINGDDLMQIKIFYTSFQRF